jgi:hypothetical protein
MTDDRIADLLGWPKGRANRDSSLMHRIRLIVAEAQAEQSAQIERMRAALKQARAPIATHRYVFVQASTVPDMPLDPDDQIIVDQYDALLRMIDEAMGETNEPR